jgi:hypothetical protein
MVFGRTQRNLTIKLDLAAAGAASARAPSHL